MKNALNKLKETIFGTEAESKVYEDPNFFTAKYRYWV